MIKEQYNGMNCLYWSSQNVNNNDGVSNKIRAHIKAFNRMGIKTFLLYSIHVQGKRTTYYVDDSVFFVNYTKRFINRLCRLLFLIKLLGFIKKRKIDLLYIRYGADADYLLIKWLSMCKKHGCKIILEIPTYPYDGEFKNLNVRQMKFRERERRYREELKFYVDFILTTSNCKSIFGARTINISNGIDPDVLPMIQLNQIHDTINLIAVAHLAFWHGYDRLIKGLYNYYQTSPHIIVNLTIVGGGHKDVIDQLSQLISTYNMRDYIKLVGPKMGKELDDMFVGMNMAVGCLGCHRKGIVEVKSLKNVEYATRGLPFLYSELNSDFDNSPYVLKVPADDSDIDVYAIVDFIQNLKLLPQDIRDSVKHLSWSCQFEKMMQEL